MAQCAQRFAQREVWSIEHGAWRFRREKREKQERDFQVTGNRSEVGARKSDVGGQRADFLIAIRKMLMPSNILPYPSKSVTVTILTGFAYIMWI